MFQVLVAVLSPFVGVAVHGAIARQYFERNRIDFPEYVGNCFFILGTSALIVSLVFWYFSQEVSRLTRFPMGWVWIIPVLSLLNFVVITVLTIWQVRMMAVRYGTYQILHTTTNLAISVLMVVGLGMNWKGRIAGQFLAAAIFTIAAVVILWRGGWLKLRLNSQYMRNALKFGIPLIPHQLGGWSISMIDRIFITRMVGLASTGIYSVGYQVGLVIGLLQDSFNRAWVPWLFGELKKNDTNVNIRIVKIIYTYFAVIFAGAICLGLVSPWFLDFFVGEQFSGAGKFVLWIAVGYAFDGMYKMVANFVYYSEKTYLLSWVTFLTAIINIILNYILISLNGAIGAAQATVCSFSIAFIFTWMLSARVFEMPYSLRVRESQR
jgi:O-antigen/teichoic acid export membrane protein